MVDLVRLVARLDGDDTGFRATLGRATRDLDSFGARAQRTASATRGAFSGIAAGWTSMAGVLAAVGVTAGFASLVNDARSYERQLNAIRAVTQASAREMRFLSLATRRSAGDFRIGANAAASAAYELTKSGVSLEALGQGALDAAIVLAQATGGEYADAATIAARATSVFRLETEDMSRVVQGAVAVINAGHFELQDYVLALQQGGAAARDAGFSLEDFNTLLALTQRALGSSGSDTGTAARTFLSRLVPQSREAAAAMRELGLSFYTAEGEFIGLDATAEELRRAFSALSDEQRNYNLVTIFGVDAQRQAIALMQDGEAGLNAIRTEMAAAGTAAEMAEARTSGFAGATANLSSAFEELGVAIGESGLNDLLAALTNWAAGGTRNLATGIEAISRDGLQAINDPAIRALENEGRRRSGNWFGSNRQALDEAFSLMTAREIVEFLDQTRNPSAWAGSDRAFLSETFAGERLRQQLLESAGAQGYVDPRPADFSNYVQPNGIYLDGRWSPLPAWAQTQGNEHSSASFDPADHRSGEDSRWDQASWLEDVQTMLLREEEVAQSYQLWLTNIERTLAEASKNGVVDIGPLQVSLSGFETEHERLQRLGEDWARDVHSTLRDAFVNSRNFDMASFAESIAQSFRSAIYDALIGDTMQAWLEKTARSFANIVQRIFSGIGGAGGGAMPGDNGAQGGDWLGSTLGGLGRSVSSLFGGFFADGGQLAPGQWGIAGENGPEPIFGGRTGVTVYPNEDSGGGQFAQIFHIDARGADIGVEQRIKVAVQEATQRGAQAGALNVFTKLRRASTR